MGCTICEATQSYPSEVLKELANLPFMNGKITDIEFDLGTMKLTIENTGYTPFVPLVIIKANGTTKEISLRTPMPPGSKVQLSTTLSWSDYTDKIEIILYDKVLYEFSLTKPYAQITSKTIYFPKFYSEVLVGLRRKYQYKTIVEIYEAGVTFGSVIKIPSQLYNDIKNGVIKSIRIVAVPDFVVEGKRYNIENVYIKFTNKIILQVGSNEIDLPYYYDRNKAMYWTAFSISLTTRHGWPEDQTGTLLLYWVDVQAKKYACVKIGNMCWDDICWAIGPCDDYTKLRVTAGFFLSGSETASPIDEIHKSEKIDCAYCYYYYHY